MYWDQKLYFYYLFLVLLYMSKHLILQGVLLAAHME